MLAPPPAAGRTLALLGLLALLLARPPAGAGLAAAREAAGPAPADRYAIVRDDTRGVLPEEGTLYEAILEEVAAADPAALDAEAERFRQRRRGVLGLPDRQGFPAFPDLFKYPNEYRGRAVTLIGQARKIQEYPAGPTAADPDEVRVEIWLYTDDSQTNPAVVVAKSAPGLPRGDDLREPVRVTGRFFKRYGYGARDGNTRIAPLILAATVTPVKAVHPPPAGPFVLGLTAAVTVVGLSAGLWAWWLRPKRRRNAARTGGGEAPDLRGFAPPEEEPPEFPGA